MAAPKKKGKSLAQVAFGQPKVAAGAVAALILGCSYFLFIGPLLDRAARGHEYDPVSRRYDTEKAEDQLKTSKETVADYESVNAEYRAKAATALPGKPDTPALVAATDSLVRQSGLQLTALDITQAKDPLKGALDLGVLNIAMNVSGGDYLALKRLLVSLERSLRLTDVLAISFNPQTSTYQLSARSYFMRKVESGAAVSPAAVKTP